MRGPFRTVGTLLTTWVAFCCLLAGTLLFGALGIAIGHAFHPVPHRPGDGVAARTPANRRDVSVATGDDAAAERSARPW